MAEKTPNHHEETEDAETAAETPVRASRKRLVVIIAILALVFLAVGAGGLLLIWNKIATVKGTAARPAPSPPPAKAVALSLRPVVALDTFIVPLAPPDTRRFLRVTLALELVDEAAGAALREGLPDLRDAILKILSRQTLAQIVSPESKAPLRDDLLGAVRALPSGQSVKDLYFTEFVVE